MHTEFLMGNEAIALGALAAGVNLVAGYPGTPSTEVLETVAARRGENTYVEWSINEKTAMEVAAGAAYAGARAMVTCKQVGLNVATDPIMSLEYIGVKGGLVVMVADDPGPISSQTEQDTRTFGSFSKIPVLDPSSVQEAYQMVQDAFELSERLGSPVILRATTRIDHGYEALEVADEKQWRHTTPEGFIKDSSRWVIFPRLSVRRHAEIAKRNTELSRDFSQSAYNEIRELGSVSNTRKGIVSHGINWQYALENLSERDNVRLLKVATPYPFPEELAAQFLDGLDEVLCVEELDPVLEEALIAVCGKYHLSTKIRGKHTGDVKPSGENSVEYVGSVLDAYLERSASATDELAQLPPAPRLPVRPPVLCAGCPHRASFYAVKQAMLGQKTIYCGDIGCYTLGNAQPLDMCDTCLCMGAGISIAQGVYHMEPDTKAFAFVGDSTFFASGITEVINAFYNQANLTLVVLDNSTTAMTGHQPHPGTGRTAMGQTVAAVSIERVLKAIGLTTVETINPFDLQDSIEAVRRIAAEPGVKAIIFKSPCVFLQKSTAKCVVDPIVCTGCDNCINEIGCPALAPSEDGTTQCDPAQCTGCTLCEQVCPYHAISGGQKL